MVPNSQRAQVYLQTTADEFLSGLKTGLLPSAICRNMVVANTPSNPRPWVIAGVFSDCWLGLTLEGRCIGVGRVIDRYTSLIISEFMTSRQQFGWRRASMEIRIRINQAKLTTLWTQKQQTLSDDDLYLVKLSAVLFKTSTNDNKIHGGKLAPIWTGTQGKLKVHVPSAVGNNLINEVRWRMKLKFTSH